MKNKKSGSIETAVINGKKYNISNNNSIILFNTNTVIMEFNNGDKVRLSCSDYDMQILKEHLEKL